MKIPQKTISIAIPIAAVAVLVWTGLNLHFLDSSIIVPGLLALASIPFLYPLGLLFMGLPFLMTISILYGISPCVLATVPYAILGAAFLKNCSIHRKCFIFAFLVCNAFLYSLAYRLVDSSGSLVLGNIMFGVAAMVIVCYKHGMPSASVSCGRRPICRQPQHFNSTPAASPENHREKLRRQGGGDLRNSVFSTRRLLHAQE